jgi:uncharacterized repeat protein (TIGR01451 family)
MTLARDRRQGVPVRATQRVVAGTLAGTLALAGIVGLGTASPAVAVTPTQALASTTGVGGYTTGTGVHTNVLSQAGDPELTRLSLAQSSAGVSVGEPLVDSDLLGSSILTADEAGKNAYGHGAAANVALAQAGSAPPQVAPSTAEALSPAPMTAEPSQLLSLPAQLAPLAQAQLLPSTAKALTTSLASICPAVPGALISEGTAQVANAQLLSPGDGMTVLSVGGPAQTEGVTDAVSQTGLVAPSGGASGRGLSSVTTQSLAPLTLFKGVPGAETTIQVLRNLTLKATATGGTGSSLFYGFIDADGKPVADSEEVLRINGTVLTSEQVLGGDGLQLSLGVADVFIGAPAHGLDDDPTTSPTVSSTTVAGAVDFIRIKVPGTVKTGSTMPVPADSRLAPVLNPVLTPVIAALDPVLTGIQEALASAGLGVADVRLGHFEALTTVPSGGVACGDDQNPFRESFKDASSEGVVAGQTFEYTVRFPNRGSTPVTNVKVVDTFTGGPPPLELVSSTPAPSSRDGNVLTYAIGTVAPGEFVDISFTFRVPAGAANGTEYRNSAVITGTYEGRPVSQTVSVDAPTVIDRPSGGCAVDRSTKFASNLQVKTGDQFAYFVNVANSGGSPCTGVVVTDTLKGGVEPVACSDGCSRSGQDLTWRVGTLAPGASTTLSVVVRVTATSGTLPDTAVVRTDEGSTAQPSTPGPTVSPVSVGSPGKPAGCPATGCPGGVSAAPGQLPRTGASTALALGALLLVGGGLALRRRSFVG